jgi:ankyrin repeat protein
LYYTSLNDHLDILRSLLDTGAEVNAQGGHYGNALQAASQGGHEQVVKTLLDKGAEVNAQDEEYGNALQAASHRGHKQVVKMLLDAGVHQHQEDDLASRPKQLCSCILLIILGGRQQSRIVRSEHVKSA